MINLTITKLEEILEELKKINSDTRFENADITYNSQNDTIIINYPLKYE